MPTVRWERRGEGMSDVSGNPCGFRRTEGMTYRFLRRRLTYARSETETVDVSGGSRSCVARAVVRRARGPTPREGRPHQPEGHDRDPHDWSTPTDMRQPDCSRDPGAR